MKSGFHSPLFWRGIGAQAFATWLFAYFPQLGVTLTPGMQATTAVTAFVVGVVLAVRDSETRTP